MNYANLPLSSSRNRNGKRGAISRGVFILPFRFFNGNRYTRERQIVICDPWSILFLITFWIHAYTRFEILMMQPYRNLIIFPSKWFINFYHLLTGDPSIIISITESFYQSIIFFFFSTTVTRIKCKIPYLRYVTQKPILWLWFIVKS